MGAEAVEKVHLKTSANGTATNSAASKSSATNSIITNSITTNTAEGIFTGVVEASQPIFFRQRNWLRFLKQAQPLDLEKLVFNIPSEKILAQFAAVQTILMHYTSIDPVGDYIAHPIEVLDDRVQLDSLTAVICSLLKGAQGASLKALERSLRQTNSLLHSVTNRSEPSSHSLSGEVSGAEVSIGDEEFLLERGVLLDSMADSLLEGDQQGFYLLIAVGDAIVARVLIVPPRVGDGKALIAKMKEWGIEAQIFSLGDGQEARQCANEIGLAPEQIYEVASTTQLDILLEKRKPFLFVTTDPDCARYVQKDGLVAFLSERAGAISEDRIVPFRSFDLSAIALVMEEARRRASLRRRRWIVLTAISFVAASVLSYLFLL